MATSATATVTADYGPGRTATAKVISGIKAFFVDVANQVLYFKLENSDPNSPQLEYDLTGVTTFTVAISSGNYTLTIS